MNLGSKLLHALKFCRWGFFTSSKTITTKKFNTTQSPWNQTRPKSDPVEAQPLPPLVLTLALLLALAPIPTLFEVKMRQVRSCSPACLSRTPKC